MNECVGIKLLG